MVAAPASIARIVGPLAGRPCWCASFTRLLRIALLSCAALAADAQADAIPLRLIAFNDFHGHLEPGSDGLTLLDAAGKSVRVDAGGAPSLAGLIAQLRGQAENAVVFSSGDTIGAAPLLSTLFRHEPTIEVMNAIGLDFAVVGNHELDGGAEELRRLVVGGCAPHRPGAPSNSCAAGGYAGAKFPLLAANLQGAGGQPIYAPTWVKEFAGIKIGFIGVVTRSLRFVVPASRIAGMTITAEAQTLNRYAAELKSRGVEAIVAVVHEGGSVKADWNDPQCLGAEGEIFKIAAQLSPDIDLVFSAHSHQGYNCLLDTPQQSGLRVIQAAAYGRGVSVIDVVLDPATRDIDRRRTLARNIPVVTVRRGDYAAVPRDQRVAGLVGRYAALAAPIANRLVGSVVERIDRSPQDPADFASGRMIADAQLMATRAADAGGAQLALTNATGIRAALACAQAPPCPISYGQAFSVQPFGNRLIVMTLSGRQLRELLEDQQPASRKEPRFLQPSRSLSYAWKRSAAHGERVSELRLDELPIRPDTNYRVTVNSFLAEGGDGFRQLRQGSERFTSVLDIDALSAFLRAQPAYAADRGARIRLLD